jgi:hypothetical protein
MTLAKLVETKLAEMMLTYSNNPITVHSWLLGTANKTFISLQAAIECAGEQGDELSAIEVLIPTGNHRYVIIWGEQLAALIRRVCASR